MMNAREVNMNERMLITKMEYSVLNEVLKYHEWMVLGSSKTIARSCVVSSNSRGKVLRESLWTKSTKQNIRKLSGNLRRKDG
jgi:hypothetical protein